MTLRRVGGDGGVVASTAVGAGGGGGSVAAAGGRRRWWRGRVLLVVLVGVAVVAVGVGGWLWWTRPLTRSAPLPAGVEKGEARPMRSSIPPVHVEAGILRWEGLHSERHEWVATFGWAPADGGEPTRFDLRLGESIHIDGMGAVTLLEVEPAPLLGSDAPGGPPGAVVNISFAPGVSECWFGEFCGN